MSGDGHQRAGQLGLVGLGVMGHGLALNAAEHGFSIVAFDRDPEKTTRLEADAGGAVKGVSDLGQLVASLAAPRAILLLVPAGAAVDAVIGELEPRLAPGDLVLDGGNSHFGDTERRGERLAESRIHFMGLGISGGAHGARHGPSLMPGGEREDYERMRPLLEAIAARVEGLPCVTYVGQGSAGHYVKMVHNGIEYAVMQLIAETYDLMRRGLGLGDDELAAIYEDWSDGELRAYLLEATARVLRTLDEKTGQRLVHLIVDEAGQKGTGRWCSQSAMDLGVPVPGIDAAVTMRELSARRAERHTAASLFADSARRVIPTERRASFLEHLRGAFRVGLELGYAQGFALLRSASAAHDFGLNLSEIARIWRGGCIIRAALLERIQAACRSEPALANLLFAPSESPRILEGLPELRLIVSEAAMFGIAAPGLMSSLAYLDGLRAARLPASLVQALRDYFSGHGFARLDAEGTFHGPWSEPAEASHAR